MRRTKRPIGSGSVGVHADRKGYVTAVGRITVDGEMFKTRGVGLGFDPTDEMIAEARELIEARLDAIRARLGVVVAEPRIGGGRWPAWVPRPMSLRQRFAALQRCGFACAYCGRRPPEVVLHVDHRVPLARGGTSADENLVAACAECNLGKGARMLEDADEVLACKAIC